MRQSKSTPDLNNVIQSNQLVMPQRSGSASIDGSTVSPLRMQFSGLMNQSSLPGKDMSINRTSMQAREQFSKEKPAVSFRSPYLGESPNIALGGKLQHSGKKVSRKNLL